MSSNFCSQCGASIQADANFCHACGARIQKSEVPPSQSAARELSSPSLRESVEQEKQNKETEFTTDQRRPLEGKRPLSKSYIARHWRGELSLPRSYWINGLLLNIGFQFAIGIVGVIYDVVHSNVWSGLACAIAVLVIRVFWFFIVGPWQLIGLWRSAYYYFGWPVWSGIVKLQVIIGWFLYLYAIVTIVSQFLPK